MQTVSRRFAGLLLWTVASAVSLRAQSPTGATFEGEVTGVNRTPIADATVLVTNTATGERWETRTGTKGRFYIEHLSIGGPYRLQVRAVGFAPLRRENVYLALGQRLTLEVGLRPAAMELESLTVVARADARINPSRTGPAQVIAESTIARVPIRGRDFSELALLSPQVVRGPTGGLSIAGQPDRPNSFQLDGASFSDLLGTSFLGGAGAPGQDFGAKPLAVEVLQELQVVSAPFDVRFGNFAAGLVNAVTKTGTNRFEGAGFGYFAGRGLVGKDSQGGRGGDFENWELGMTAGGPIVRDRAAFFANFGAQHSIFPDGFPLIGSDTANGSDSVGVGIRRASVTRLQSILRERFGVDPGRDDESIPLHGDGHNLFAKVTMQLGVNSRMELSHNYSHNLTTLFPFNFGACREPGAPYCLSSMAFSLPVTTHATRLSWTGTIGRRFANELLLARMQEVQRCRPASTFPTLIVHADQGELAAGTAEFCGGELTVQRMLELTDNLSFSAGAHRLVAGTHDELIRLPTHQGLQFLFHDEWHFNSLDSLEQGLADHYTGTFLNPARPAGPFSDLTVRQFGLYLQDQWTPGRRLTITAGLRVDVPFISNRPNPNPVLRQELGLDNTVSPTGHPLWSPRLGFNDDLAGDGVTFVRGGVGVFAGRPAYKWLNEVYVHTGLDALAVDCTGSLVPPFTIDPRRQPTSCGEAATTASALVNTFDPAFRYPRNLKIALGVDRRLPGGMVGTLDLLYTRSLDQLDLGDLNLAAPVAANGEGGRLLYGRIDSAGNATPSRPSPDLTQVIQVRNSSGDRAFSVTGQLQKSFGHGTELAASYTFSRSRDRLSAADDGLAADLSIPLDGSLAARRLATAAWEVPHRLLLLATTDLPYGLRLSLFYEGLSGRAYTYIVDGDANADGFGNDIVYLPARSRIGGDVALGERDSLGNLAPAVAGVYDELDAFLGREGCLRGQRGTIMRRNSCRNPWVNHTSAKLSALLPAPGGHTMELSLQVFNVLHLVDRDWGVVRGVEHTSLLRLIGYDSALSRGIYALQIPRLKVVDVDASRWRMSLGARYSF